MAGIGLLWLLAGRGHLHRAANRHNLHDAYLRTWQRLLLNAARLEYRDFPSGPVSAFGDDIDTARTGYWLHADLVHLAAGLDRLTFLPLTGAAAVTAAEREALMPLIADHLQGSSLHLQPGASGQWFLRSQRSLDLHTVSPEAAAAIELETAMPSGPDAREVRLAMTECQMLLHDHPVNERRQRRGLPPINALWPWGGGTLKPQSVGSLPRMFSNDTFVRGLYRNHSQEISASSPAATLIEHAVPKRAVIAVVEVDTPARLEAEWIEPLVAALRSGHIRQLDLFLDEWQILATRRMLRRFWRKPSPPSAWPT